MSYGYNVVGAGQMSLIGRGPSNLRGPRGVVNNGALREWQSRAMAAEAAYNDAMAALQTREACPPGPYSAAVEVVEQNYTRSGRRPLGFPPTVVVAGATSGPIVSQPQKPFKSQKLIIPSSIGAAFLVTSLQIGNDEMLMNGNGVPALAFNENAVDAWLSLETAQISQNVSITVTNISGSNATFYGAMFGIMVRA